MNDNNKSPDRRNVLDQALRAIETLQGRLDAVERDRHEPIAIVGLSCRFPGAPSTDAYWRLLIEGRNAVGEVPDGRWDKSAYYDPDPSAPGKMHAPYGGFLDQIDLFDAAFFGIAGREAETMDPQQRLLLETTWEALESAGIAAGELRDSRTGVFVGITTMDYARLAISGGPAALDVYTATGGALNVAAGRISYTLGLNGPAIAVDTACSSSLVALHLACQSLRSHDCNAALVGGVNALLTPEPFVCFAKWGMMAPDGRCKTFDEKADGFVRSEGCGVLVLKRLSDARAAGDRVLALVRATAVNQDGASSGLTVPNGLAQQAVVRAALEAAEVEPSAVDYIEAHGTGTTLGDPIELEALATVLGKNRPADRPLRVGSVKTNIGHAESASGIAGLIKVVLSLNHDEIPPHLHFEKLNSRISLLGVPVEIPTRASPWPRTERRRLAGVSSFGFSGTNAHVLVEEAPAEAAIPAPGAGDRSAQLLVMAAKSEVALRALARAYAQRLIDGSGTALADICHSAAVGRSAFTHRLAVVATGAEEAAAALGAFARGEQNSAIISGQAEVKPKIAFLFTGQGAQYAAMGSALYAAEPVFRSAFDRCAGLLRAELEVPLEQVLGYAPGSPPVQALLDETQYTQPALFAFEYALAELWRSWGIKPVAVMGHSLGELVAACVAGVMTLEDALVLVATRARLMQSLPQDGAMAAILVDEDRVRDAVAAYPDSVAIAAVNGPQNTVISGRAQDVHAITERFANDGIEVRPLTVSHAFHSPLLEPMLDELERCARGISVEAPRIDLVSNVSGAVLDAATRMDAAYWRRHARATVRFADSVRVLDARGVDAYLEIGPAPVLTGMARQCLPETDALFVGSMRKGQDIWPQLLVGLGALYVLGANPNWRAYDEPYPRRRVALPHYPFQRKRFWLRETAEPVQPALALPAAPADEAGHPLLGARRRSPLRELQFDCRLDPRHQPILSEHRVAGLTVVPAAALIELAHAAATAALATPRVRLEGGSLRSALVLDRDQSGVDVQLIASPDAGGVALELFSRPRESGTDAAAWTNHAGVHAAPIGEQEIEASSLNDAYDRCATVVDIEAYRAKMASVGLDYGPSFNALVTARRTDGEAVGELRLPPGDELWRQVAVHPGMLDAAFHLIGLALADEDGDRFYLPVGYESVAIHRALGPEARAHARVRSVGTSRVVADVTLAQQDGLVAVEVQGLEVRAVAPEQFRAALGVGRRAETRDRGLLRIAWRGAARPGVTPAGTWWLFGDTPLGERVAAELAAQSATVEVVDGEAVGPRLARLKQGDVGDLRGIIDLRALALPVLAGSGASEAPSAVLDGSSLDATLALLRCAAGAPKLDGLRFVLVTRQAQAVLAHESVNPFGAIVWGVAATAAAELSQLDLRMLDVDDSSTAPQAVLEAACRLDAETRLGLRAEQSYVARLVPLDEPSEDRLALPDGSYVLEMRERGTLTGLGIAASVRQAPGPGQVEVEVLASGLNFRDVLNLLDMYPGPPGPLGNECCGRVVAVGDGVDTPAVGDLVTCIAESTFSSHIVADARLAFPVPPQLSLAQAAAFPIAQLTAYLALHRVGGIAAGDRVLIHAGAGGVGLAAVQLALAAGAEVLASAGSKSKREFLRGLGVHAVFDSRAPLAAGTVRDATDGHGVDIVLNSLTGEFIDEGLRSLAPAGRFIEIGLRELRTPEQVRSIRTDVRYEALLLGDMCREDPAAVREMYDELVALLVGGRIPAPRVRSYPVAEAGEAFSFMAKARHIGRIAITHPAAAGFIRADASYLVSGGLGALGMHVADWLVDRGAKHLVLLGRSAPSATAAVRLERLRAAGARVDVVSADVAASGALERLSEMGLPPLRGVVHAAGIVDDAMIANVDAARMARALRPKADGAQRLASLAAGSDLEFFVFYSSGSALLGSPGQAAYAGANAFLDAYAHLLRAEGRAALSVNWGAWEDGMAAGVDERTARIWAERGIGTLSAARGMAALERALASGQAQAAALAIDWAKFFAGTSAADRPALLTELDTKVPQGAAESATVQGSSPTSLEALRRMPSKQRLKALTDELREHAGSVLGVGPAELDSKAGLTEQGIDSLMAMELATRLGKAFAVSLPSTFVFEHPTLQAIAVYLIDALDLAGEPEDGHATKRGAQPDAASEQDERVAGMSADEASAALLDELDKIGY